MNKNKLIWINIFIRDLLLALVIAGVNYMVEYQSWWAAFCMGAIVVLLSWHLSDFIRINKSLEEIK